MNRKKALIVAGGLVVATVVGTGVAVAAGGDDVDTPITGAALDRATAAALDHLGEGTVTETEVGDEESLYEVEVTLDDGTQIDVQLDESFNVVATEEEGADEADDAD